MKPDISVHGGEVHTPVGDAPVIPLMMIFLGGYLAWFGIKYFRDSVTVWPSDPIKDVMQGKGLPAPSPPETSAAQDISTGQGDAGATQQARADASNAAILAGGGTGTGTQVSGGSVTGDDIAKDIEKYIGHKYVFGGAPGTDGKSGWDCSSCVNWVVGHDLKLSIPSFNHGSYDGATHGPSTLSWISWTGCKTVPHRDVKPGDLLIWESHMGIAISKTEMISAEDPAQGTQKSTIKGMQSSLRTETLVVRRIRETVLTAATTGKGGTPGANKAIGKLLAARYGWSTGTQWADLVKLWDQESGWNNKAKNPSSGAYGIAQALPPTKYPKAGQESGGSSASAQIAWGLKYIKDRYGSPSKAWAHEVANNWY